MPPQRTLLYLARDFPIPVSSGARLRTFNWVLHLSRRFDVFLVATARRPPEPSHLDALRPYCAHIDVVAAASPTGPARWLRRLGAEASYLARGLPPEASWLQSARVRAAWASLSSERRFDVVFAERWTWGGEALAAGHVAVIDAGEMQSGRVADRLAASRQPLRRLFGAHLARAFSRHEASVLARAAFVLTRDAANRRAVDALLRGPGQAIALPSGLDTRYFAPRRHAVDPRNVAFLGPLASPVQRDALLHLHRDLLPAVRARLRPVRLTVVDADPVPELAAALREDPHLHFTGALDDVRPELWRAAVAAAPSRFGAGSPDRIAQLLAMGIPVVATATAARGLDLRSGDGLIVAPDGPDFSLALSQVLLDASLREDLSRRGRETAEARLSMAATYDRISSLLATASAAP
jgi:glycosyltransferase involved in cell wall biosynthesis